MKPIFTYSPKPALEPKAGCQWADTMVLNPAIIKDPVTDTLHMLFRATGPWPQKRMDGSPFDPYPIFLGYAKSEDIGKTICDSPPFHYSMLLTYKQNLHRYITLVALSVIIGCIKVPSFHIH